MSFNDHCHVTGFPEDLDRSVFKKEFSKFGHIRKLYTDVDGKLAKVYYQDPQDCQKAAGHLKKNLLGWRVVVRQDKPPQGFSKPEVLNKNPDMHYIEDDVYVDPVTEEYVNVYGSPVEALMDGENEIYVRLSDVQATGFAIFKKTEYNRLQEQQKRDIKTREFELHMLQEATNFLLKHSLVFVEKELILDTIAKCKERLLGHQDGNDVESKQPNRRRTLSKNENNYARSKSSSRNSNHQLTYNEPRPAKTLPNNFGPTQTQRSTGQHFNNRNQRNRRDDSFTNNDRSRQYTRQTDDEELWDSTNDRDPNFSVTIKNNFVNKNADAHSQHGDSAIPKKSSLVKSLESVDEMSKIVLNIGQTYDVRVSHVEKDKANNICWVHETEALKQLDDLLLLLDDVANGLEPLEDVARGQLGMAVYDEVWCRCRVIGMNPLNVLFIDYGNRSDVESIKELPQSCRKIPALATRIVIDKKDAVMENEMDIKITVQQKYHDDTYLIALQQVQQNREISAKENHQTASVIPEIPKFSESEKRNESKFYFDMPKPMHVLGNGDKVMLIGLEGDRFIVRTREGVQKSKEILEYIKSLNKSEMMLSQVKEGQLVLCSKDGLPNLCRGVVVEKETPNIVRVKYLDYAGEDRLSVKSLRNFDEKLANEPLTRLYTPKMEVIADLGEKSVDFIGGLLDKKEKVKVIITEDQDFDLQLEEGVLLTQKLLEMEKPEMEMPKLVPVASTPIKKNVEVEKEEPIEMVETKVAVSQPEIEVKTEVKSGSDGTITYNDMPYIKAEVGVTTNYICYTITDLTEITLISMTDESVAHMERISDLDIKDAVPFEPEVMDMCVVSYKTEEEEEPSWYRAVVLDKESSGYLVSMVDFGSQVVVPSKDIRKFPTNLKDIPILGILCSLHNITNNEKNLKRVKELLPEGEEVTVAVKEFVEDELKYLIEIPELYEKLKKEGTI